MPQFLHPLVVDRTRGVALAAWYGKRWLLPMLPCTERARAGPAILRWAEQQELVGDVLGQWLGRPTPDGTAIDWLAVFASDERRTAGASALCWTPLGSLSSSASLLDYQEWAIRKAMTETRLPSVSGPFGALTWLDRIKAWAGEMAGASQIGPITPYRTSPYEVVLAMGNGPGQLFFKGLASDRVSEPRITSALAAVSPASFATTLALEERPDGSVWWLTHPCPGSSLARRWSADRAVWVARACADIQRQAMTPIDVQRVLPRVPLSSAFEWSVESIERSAVGENADARSAAIERAFDDVGCTDVPHSWIPLDLDPENVLVEDAGAVRFIDLEDSYCGPAPLALATFARRIRRRRIDMAGRGALENALRDAYEQAWSPLGFTDCAWHSFDLVSIILEAYLGWQRLVRATERGEIIGPLDRAATRIAEQLAHAVNRMSEAHNERR